MLHAIVPHLQPRQCTRRHHPTTPLTTASLNCHPDCKLPRAPQVQFLEESSAQEALRSENGQMFLGQRLVVEPHQGRYGGGGMGGGGMGGGGMGGGGMVGGGGSGGMGGQR